eukprot:Skav236095  [mRNA]  locus=scaffold1166:148753:149951:+ [translate_table: standard]
MFNRYIARREQIKQKRLDGGEKCEVPDPAFFTRDWMSKNPGSELCELDDRVNEVLGSFASHAPVGVVWLGDWMSLALSNAWQVYLWHGTQVRVGLQIAMNDFKLEFAGSGAGAAGAAAICCGLQFALGRAVYGVLCAAWPSHPNGACSKDGIRALLLCRVCVGKFYYTQGREPTAIDKYTAGEADSTLGDRAKSVNTYREIVVYDADQAPGRKVTRVWHVMVAASCAKKCTGTENLPTHSVLSG